MLRQELRALKELSARNEKKFADLQASLELQQRMNDESYRKLLSSNNESVQALERATRFVTQAGDCISFDRQRFIGQASGLGQHIDKRFDDVMETLRVMQDLPQRPRNTVSQTPDERYALILPSDRTIPSLISIQPTMER